MIIDIPDTALQELAALIARNLEPAPDLETLPLKALADESGVAHDTLRHACIAFEQGNPHGLRCMRSGDTDRAPILVARSWFLAWRETQATTNQRQVAPII